MNNKQTFEESVTITDGKVRLSDNYEQLIEGLGIRQASNWTDVKPNKGGVFFDVGEPKQMWLSMIVRGIAYLPEMPDGIIKTTKPSLDKAERHFISNSHFVFQHVEGNWYLFEFVEEF